MVAVAFSPHPERQREPLTARAVMLIIVALIHLVLLLILLFAARSKPKLVEMAPTVVRMIPLTKPSVAPSAKPKAAAKHKTNPVAAKAPVPIVKMPPDKAPPAAPLFKTEMFEAVDITKLPSHKGEQSAVADSSGTGSGTEDGLGPGVGSGPHGEQLYAAQWYREPTDAEVRPYLPKHLPDTATADIMCRTIEHFGVEDCQELGETPIGTGLSRAIRQAGWQFKVKPVRLGQKFEVGTWVRIRYTITMTHQDAG